LPFHFSYHHYEQAWPRVCVTVPARTSPSSLHAQFDRARDHSRWARIPRTFRPSRPAAQRVELKCSAGFGCHPFPGFIAPRSPFRLSPWRDGGLPGAWVVLSMRAALPGRSPRRPRACCAGACPAPGPPAEPTGSPSLRPSLRCIGQPERQQEPERQQQPKRQQQPSGTVRADVTAEGRPLWPSGDGHG
jgi:hypothetical protein